MSAPYFYQTNIPAKGSFMLSEETSKHCIQVLRMKAGEAIHITDGCGNTYEAIITSADKKHCIVAIQTTHFTAKTKWHIAIGISLLKNANRFEWFLEKATELGVQEIYPLLCQRTEKQHFRFDRMQTILVSAMLQSKQVWLPQLHEPTKLREVIATTSYTQKLIAHCEEAEKKTLMEYGKAESTLLLIGPEGDFSPEEIEWAQQQGFAPTHLGNTRLRTETAGIVAASLLINR